MSAPELQETTPKVTYREESSLEDTENLGFKSAWCLGHHLGFHPLVTYDTKGNQLVPLLDKAKADHRSTPEDCYGREKFARPKLSQHDRCYRLKQNVRNEENQNND
jgi:hypothetical protein